MTNARWILALATVGAAAAAVAAGDEADEYAAVLKALPEAKHSLADGVRAAATGSGVALSAKYEIGEEGASKGKLVLSVYTAAKGLTDDPWKAGLSEVAGAAAAEKWAGETEEIKGGDDLAHAAQQETLLALTNLTLADVVAKAEKASKGTVVSATPEVRGRKAVFVVETAADGKVSEWLFDAKSGDAVPAKSK
jgi:uncharacterized membrane protein YkoI